MFIQLTESEIDYIKSEAKKRDNNCQINNFKGVNSSNRSNLENHILGALGEFAVAKALNIEWNNKLFNAEEYKDRELKSRGNDVGIYEVRTTAVPSGRLPIRQWDKDANYILVIQHSIDYYEIVGWINSVEAKNEFYWMANWPVPCWAVSQLSLNNMESLPR